MKEKKEKEKFIEKFMLSQSLFDYCAFQCTIVLYRNIYFV